MLKQIIQSMRPRQWYKNIVLFAGLVFSLNLLNIELWPKSLLAFLAFCLVSGAGYIFNDIIDRKKDSLHQRKSKRPIASGSLNPTAAFLAGKLILLLALALSYRISLSFAIASASYFALTLFYSLYIKNWETADIIAISLGFVIRAVAGCIAISVFISPWLILCTFLLAMFLALGKRRSDLPLGKQDTHSKEIIDQMTTITTAVLIASYSLYTFLSGNHYMLLTIPFPVYCLFRYIALIKKDNSGSEPEKIITNRGIMIAALTWAAMVAAILFA